ncbi:histidinol dehydrogenase [Conexibacter sp. JD483]|uniref:histidinol dehydrogenase n=1 Tax=unclassified Conexibacter TaxID=2627773 RepID=UPI00271EEE6A|nr:MULTISPECIES: histidinol dehydrogenase [unclassified Conexibacter]MDO8187765.1 histidinol dehydrogenase [Conexibacter sp. CPCC 205706]MDO8201374.1 histidinol dehydrogenase [Conexibacter sp. CPCC 205762]MDR9372859.1 histidinol dehydrogenase [Conexibacter sp. JD483]
MSISSELRHLKTPGPRSTRAPLEVSRRVEEMLADLEAGGADAVRRWSRELDGWDPDSFVVGEADIAAAADALDDDLKRHIAIAQRQVRTFAEAQRATLSDMQIEPLPGIVLGQRHIPIESVGAYVPGGRYPMLASSFMTIIVAKAAGVDNVVATAPPQRSGGIHPAMLYAMHTSGADAIVALGGVQALAALAFGTADPSIPAVDMLVGAGNAYVAEAKRQLFGHVGIDLLAGPTEVLVVADATADPRIVAADLLGQAEHGPTSVAGAIAIGEEVAQAIADQIEDLLKTWPTAEIAGQAWRELGWIAIAADDDEAIALANENANEHLEIQVDPDKLDDYRARLRNYGSLFLGEEATVAYGDKGVGTNHVLPTSRAARYTGGLWVGKFLKTVTWQQLTEDGTRAIAPTIEAICEAEQMLGHGVTATMRLDRLRR